MQNKKQHYRIVYVATGFMGNKYDAGVFEFDVSDREIKKGNYGDPMKYGFCKNFKVLARHFPPSGTVHPFVAAYITNNNKD